MTHLGHEIVKCSDCGIVIRQCRCMSKDKPTKFEHCGCIKSGETDIPNSELDKEHPDILIDYDGFTWIWIDDDWKIDVARSGGPPSIHHESPKEPPPIYFKESGEE